MAIGEAAPLVTAALAASVPVRDAASMDDASFDMFVDYAERGRRFKDAVARLAFEVKSVREQ